MPLFQHDFALDTLSSLADVFKRSSIFIDRSRARQEDLKMCEPQIKHIHDYLPRLSIVEHGPDFSFDVDGFYRRPQDAQANLSVGHELRVTVSSASFVRHEFVDLSGPSLLKSLEHFCIGEESLLDLVLSESPLEKLMMRLDNEMTKSRPLKGRDNKKSRRREFVITKDSPISSLQGVLASIPDHDDEDPLSFKTTLMHSSPISLGEVDDSTCEPFPPPLPDQPFRSPVHEKRKCRQFIRDLVRKVFPTSVGDFHEPDKHPTSRWSSSTGGESDWTAISAPGSMDDHRGIYF